MRSAPGVPADRALALVLHGHLPWCKGEPEAERWLAEAVAGCYLPLLEVLRGLDSDGVRAPLALSLSPPLVAMLDDPGLRGLARAQLEALAHATGPAGEAERFHRARAGRLLALYDAVGRDLPSAFFALAKRGALELFGCAATHGYLPLLNAVPAAARAQVRYGAALFERRFGAKPLGLWLPECGYSASAKDWLAQNAVRWCVLDGPAVPARGHAFLSTGVAVFAREPALCQRVWDAEVGYPGHPDYLDFHHRERGLRLSRVTGRGPKEPWDPGAAFARARSHAADFHAALAAGRPGLAVAAFDAELFGHWWFEGPEFLDALLRRCAEAGEVDAVVPSGWLAEHTEAELVEPLESSWGRGGFHATWLSERNQRLWPLLTRAAERMVALAELEPPPTGLSRLAVELLLAQASDWPFLLDAGASTALAARRVEGHLASFFRCADAALKGDWAPLAALESTHNPLGQVDVRVYRAPRVEREAQQA
jgi:1,4-alpha-glucan branching enzyme